MKEFNTNDVDYKKFSPHGNVSFSVIENKIFLYRAAGPFNLELMLALDKIELEVEKNIKKGEDKWCEIVVFLKNHV